MKTKRKPTAEQKRRKANKLLSLRRVEDLFAIRVDGAEFPDIREYVRAREAEEGSPWHTAEGEPPMCDSMIYKYLARADKLFFADCQRQHDKHFNAHFRQRRRLYARAITSGELSVALNVLKDEAELLDLYPAKRSDRNPNAPDKPTLLGEVIIRVVSSPAANQLPEPTP